MLSWTVTFLVIALIAALLGFGGIASTATAIAKILFIVFLVLFLASLVTGAIRRSAEQRCRCQGADVMKGIFLVGVFRLLAGVAALAWPAITYTKTEKVADLGPVHLTKESEKRIPLPPLVDGVAVAAGVAMVVAGSRGGA